jgi:DNA-binding NarL/FixJ family response regulator
VRALAVSGGEFHPAAQTTLQELLSTDYIGSDVREVSSQPDDICLLGTVGFDTRRQKFILLLFANKSTEEVGAKSGIESIHLSEREQEVLHLVAAGASNAQIAYRLIISQNTVKVHLRHIFEKLNVQSRTGAAMLALHYGWFNLVVSIK